MRYGDLVHTEVDVQGIEYRLYIAQDDSDVRGNAMASGDDAEDKAFEDEIIERLDSGDVWAWAQTTCEASFQGFTGHDFLGACCYRDTAEFIQPDGYWPDMKNEAKSELLDTLDKACKAQVALGRK